MRVVRGRERTPAADRERSRSLLEWAGAEREPAVRVWAPHQQVAFGRRDATEPGYDEACQAARRHGFSPVERDVGGRAVAYTGSTLAFARYEPVEDPRQGLGDRYERLTRDVVEALADVGVDPARGEPEDTFCPGQHSLQDRGKLVGIAQRVTADAAVVSGILVVDQHDRIADVLAVVYDALGVPFDPSTVGSVAQSGGDVDAVRDAVEGRLVGSAPVTVESI
jgi:lipoate-protein ligase A